MAENNSTNTSSSSSKGTRSMVKNFLKSQLLDIQFTNPFTGAVHNLMNAPEAMKNTFMRMFKGVFKKPITRDLKHTGNIIPINDVVDGIATVLNTTFYGWNWASRRLQKIKSSTTRNDMDKVEFAKMCKKCPVKMHDSTDITSYKDTYWTILEPEKNQEEAFKKIFGTSDKIMLLYWNDTVKGNASKYTSGIENLLANLTENGNQIVKIAFEPDDTTSKSTSNNKVEQKEKEDIRRAEQMSRRKKYGLTASTGQFSWEPTLVENILQAKKENVQWIKVFRDTDTEIFTLSESNDSENEKTSDEKLLDSLFKELNSQQNNPYQAKKINDKIKSVFGKIIDERIKAKKEEIEKIKSQKETYGKKKIEAENEDRTEDEEKYEELEKKAEEKIDSLDTEIQKLESDKPTLQEWITYSREQIDDELDKCEKEESDVKDDLIEGRIDNDEAKSKLDTIGLKRKMLNDISKYNLVGLTRDEREKKNKEDTEAEIERSKTKVNKDTIIGKIDKMDITGGVLHVVCDIRNMEKTIDGKDAIDNKQLTTKLKNIKSSDDFQLGLSYDKRYEKIKTRTA